MYTVLWQEAGSDRWDRFESKEEIIELLSELSKNPDVCIYDVWVFSPEADDYAFDYDMIKDWE